MCPSKPDATHPTQLTSPDCGCFHQPGHLHQEFHILSTGASQTLALTIWRPECLPIHSLLSGSKRGPRVYQTTTDHKWTVRTPSSYFSPSGRTTSAQAPPFTTPPSIKLPLYYSGSSESRVTVTDGLVGLDTHPADQTPWPTDCHHLVLLISRCSVSLPTACSGSSAGRARVWPGTLQYPRPLGPGMSSPSCVRVQSGHTVRVGRQRLSYIIDHMWPCHVVGYIKGMIEGVELESAIYFAQQLFCIPEAQKHWMNE